MPLPTATADFSMCPKIHLETLVDLGTLSNFMDWDFAKTRGIPTLCKNSPNLVETIDCSLLSSGPVTHQDLAPCSLFSLRSSGSSPVQVNSGPLLWLSLVCDGLLHMTAASAGRRRQYVSAPSIAGNHVQKPVREQVLSAAHATTWVVSTQREGAHSS